MHADFEGVGDALLYRGSSSALGGLGRGSLLLALGAAMFYPTLPAAIGDVAHPSWRASAAGIYRSGVTPGTRLPDGR